MRILLIMVIVGIMLAINSFMPKKDYSHIPKEYRHLVRFAESAGM